MGLRYGNWTTLTSSTQEEECGHSTSSKLLLSQAYAKQRVHRHQRKQLHSGRKPHIRHLRESESDGEKLTHAFGRVWLLLFGIFAERKYEKRNIFASAPRGPYLLNVDQQLSMCIWILVTLSSTALMRQYLQSDESRSFKFRSQYIIFRHHQNS
jgi:hypothetical protein